MKIKTLIFSLVLKIVFITHAFGFGIGAQFNANADEYFSTGIALAISPSHLTHLTFYWDFGSNTTIGFTADFIPLRAPFVSSDAGSLNFTLGPGFFIDLLLNDESEDSNFRAGLRLPVGVNFMTGRGVFEIYSNVAPSFRVRAVPSFGIEYSFFTIALGARFWLR